MKKQMYKSGDRGSANHGWLKAKHSFSFGQYFDAEKVHFGALRVLNDDIIAPAMGFGMHPHDNMEIVTIPLEGALEHKDNTGGNGVIKNNEVQVMSAGTGIFHSEFNHSSTEETKLLQCWVFPKEKDIEPRYDQKQFNAEDRLDNFQLLAGGDLGKESGALWINQDAYFSRTTLSENTEKEYTIKHTGNGAYVFLIDGKIEIDGTVLETRDAVGISECEAFNIKANSKSELLIIEVPMNY